MGSIDIHALVSATPSAITGQYRVIFHTMGDMVLVKNGEFQPLDEFAAETMQTHLRASIQSVEEPDGSYLRAKVLAPRWELGAFDLQVDQGVPAIDDEGEETTRVESSVISYVDLKLG